jgi:uncharacterized membrane protein YjfL (UPF0719 family)
MSRGGVQCNRQIKLEAGMDIGNYALTILISLAVGIIGFILAYKIFDWMTPGVNFSDQLKEGNRAVAIFLAGLFIGLGLLLGSAIK